MRSYVSLSLAEITAFLPGSADYAHKWEVTNQILRMSIPERKTMMNGYFTYTLKTSIYDFALNKWEASQRKNISLNNEKALYPAPQRLFGKWYEANFEEDVNFITVWNFCCG
jgi:hypothetical protein